MSKKNNFQQLLNKNASHVPNLRTRRKIYDDPSKGHNISIINIANIYISNIKKARIICDNNESIIDLSENIKHSGQIQPCLVRYAPTNKGEYELIVGERRFHAVSLGDCLLKCIVVDYNDEQVAINILSENNNRKDISDYELYLQISYFFIKKIIKQSDIVSKTGISKQKISKLLKYKYVGDHLKILNDLSKVSASTVEYISNLEFSETTVAKISEIKDKIQSGVYGHTKIKNHLSKPVRSEERHLEINTFKVMKNKSISILPATVTKLANKDSFMQDLGKLISKHT